MDIDEVLTEIRVLKEQAASDFEWTAQALGDVSERMIKLGDHVRVDLLDLATHVHGEMSQMGQVMKGTQGRLGQLDQRFSAILAAFEKTLQGMKANFAPLAMVKALEARLEVLERKQPPAA